MLRSICVAGGRDLKGMWVGEGGMRRGGGEEIERRIHGGMRGRREIERQICGGQG